MRQVFLSSTARDLTAYRDAAYQAIEGLDGFHCCRMEDFGARAISADQFCREQVEKCDLVVAIVGHLYGSCPRNDARSFTMIEYEAAVAAQKPILVFMAGDDFPVPAALIEPELQRAGQLKFRKLISARVAAFFTQADELARLVIQAIRNWEMTTASAPRPARPAAARQPNRGWLVAKMCNRRAQEETFREVFFEALKRRPGAPQIYIVQGEEGECHESLVERLAHTVTGPGAGSDLRTSTVRAQIIPWNYASSSTLAKDRLLYRVFELFASAEQARSGELVPSRLAGLISRSLKPLEIIQHDLFAAQWNRGTFEAFAAYIRFWSDWRDDPSRPQVLIFLNVIYPSGSSPADWRFWYNPRRIVHGYRKRRIKRQLTRLSRQFASHGSLLYLLDELQPVSREDVLEWFILNRIGSEDIRLKKLREIFPARHRTRQSMGEIERRLKDFQSELALAEVNE